MTIDQEDKKIDKSNTKKALLVGCNWKKKKKKNTKKRKNRKNVLNQKNVCIYCISLHSLLQATMWHISPKLTVGPICDWHRVVKPVPHHVVSPSLNSIHCPMKLILLWSNKWQRQCLSLTLSSSLCELYAAFCSPSCSLLREASATTTVAMTKGSICSHIGPIL